MFSLLVMIAWIIESDISFVERDSIILTQKEENQIPFKYVVQSSDQLSSNQAKTSIQPPSRKPNAVSSNTNQKKPNYQKVHGKYNPSKKILRETSNDNIECSLINAKGFDKIIVLVRKGLSIEAVSTFEKLISATHRVGLFHGHQLVKELGNRGELNLCIKVVEIMKSKNILPNLGMYSTLISRSGSWLKVSLAEEFFRKMIDQGIQPDAPAFNSLIHAYAKSNELSKAFAVLTKMPQYHVTPTVITFNTLIDACSRIGDITTAEKVLTYMKDTSILPNMRTYTTLLHLYCRAGNLSKAQELLHAMEQDPSNPPSEVSYSILIHAYGAQGDIEGAFKTLKVMNDRKIVPNVIALSSLIHSCGKANHLDLAFGLFYEMFRSDNPVNHPNSVTCSSLVDNCLKAGLVDKAFEVLQVMRDRLVPLTEVTYTSLISELTKLGQLERISEIGMGESDEGLLPHVKGDALRKPRAAKAVFPTSAKTIVEGMTISSSESNDRTGAPGQSSQNSSSVTTEIIDSYVFQDILNEIKSIHSHPIQYNVPPTPWIRISTKKTPTTATIQTHEVSNDPALAKRNVSGSEKTNTLEIIALYEKLKAEGIEPNISVYKVLLNSVYESVSGLVASNESLSRVMLPGIQPGNEPSNGGVVDNKGKQSIDPPMSPSSETQIKQNHLFRLYLIFQEMKIAGVQPDTSVYNTLINACAGSGDLDKAMETFQAMRYEGIEPNVITYTSLIKACSKVGGPQAIAIAEEIFSAMQQRTNHFSSYIEPNESTFVRLIQTHLKSGDGMKLPVNTERVWELFEEMQKRGIRPGITPCWFALRSAQIDRQDYQKGLKVLNLIRKDATLRFDQRCWEIVISMCEWHREYGLMESLQSEMRKYSENSIINVK